VHVLEAVIGGCEASERRRIVTPNLSSLALGACAGPLATISLDVRPYKTICNKLCSGTNAWMREVMQRVEDGTSEGWCDKGTWFTGCCVTIECQVGTRDSDLLQTKACVGVWAKKFLQFGIVFLGHAEGAEVAG
jgi:hypothetical protein